MVLSTNFTIADLTRNVDGSIFQNEGDGIMYAKWFFGSVFFFSFVYAFWSNLFERIIKPERYMKFDDVQKANWNATWVANTHHIILCTIILNTFIYPNCDNPYPFQFFYEDSCFYLIDYRYAIPCFICCGYLTYDFYVQHYIIKDDSPLGRQMVWHHFLGILGIGVGTFIGYAHTGIMAF